MIGKLTGKLDSAGPDWAVVDVNGVGYVVHLSGRALARLPAPGEEVRFAVETVVREDLIRLYGFESMAERDWFRLLQGVQGVGARVALAILSVLDAKSLAAAVAAQDHSAFARASGVGPKLARRIATELKDKAPDRALTAAAHVASGGADAVGAPDAAGDGGVIARRDAISALVNLGYAQFDAASAVDSAMAAAGAGGTVEALIRDGLKRLGAHSHGPD
jgi:Holliday junction DNA helicase RuvA